MYTTKCIIYSVFLYVSLFLLGLTLAQNNNETKSASDALDKFALKFLATTSLQAGDTANLALSPYNIWTLMVIISEGAKENTATELQNALAIPANQDRDAFRKSYQELKNNLMRSDEGGVTLDSADSIFISEDEPLKASFIDVAKRIYNADLKPVDFRETSNAVNTINNHINGTSRGKISNLVKQDDIQNTKVFMTSVLFFKGFWETKFNETTTKEVFYDDKGNSIGEVDMMYQEESYLLSLIFDETALAVELPYKGDTMAMMIILPKRNIPLQSILDKMAEGSFSDVVDTLERSAEEFGDEPVKVYLPKFKVTSDLNLNSVLTQMGIKDIFSQSKANFSEMFVNNNLHISRIIQRAEIKVDEEGTEGAAASGVSFQYRSPTPKFIANKPFAFVVYNKLSRGIVFAGKISNPKLI